MTNDVDTAVRAATFHWLKERLDEHGDALPWQVLQSGFEFRGHRVPLVSMQGIFKPRILDYPLTLRTALDGPYDDQIDEHSAFIRYRYRGTDPSHRDNEGLREAFRRQLPLAYLVGVGGGRYEPVWPVFIQEDRPDDLTFVVAVEDASAVEIQSDWIVAEPMSEARRQYITISAKRRLHQRVFREQVLAAYREHCAVCRLRHRELLDGAHILEDYEGGPPTVPNGLALCKLHHAAYDSHVIGIHPDALTIEVRRDVLEEEDGPMLRHGLQELHSRQIELPRRDADRPDSSFLRHRYGRFRAA